MDYSRAIFGAPVFYKICAKNKVWLEKSTKVLKRI
jgi:hypothetical protein